MQLTLSRFASGTRLRLFAAAVLVAFIAVGAPMHSHDVVAIGADQTSPQKAPCAACTVSASPGLVLERADVAPRLEAVAVVSDRELAVVALPVSVRSGRAPPAV